MIHTPTGSGASLPEKGKKMAYRDLIEKERREWIGKTVSYHGEKYLVMDVDYNGSLMINKSADYTDTTAISKFDIDMYEVYWIGGERDGQTVGKFETESEAVSFAKKFSAEHENEFDECWGGVGIVDPDNNPVEW